MVAERYVWPLIRMRMLPLPKFARNRREWNVLECCPAASVTPFRTGLPLASSRQT